MDLPTNEDLDKAIEKILKGQAELKKVLKSVSRATEQEKYLRTKDIENDLNVSSNTVAQWRSLGLKYSKISSTIIYTKSDLEDFIKKYQINNGGAGSQQRLF